MESDEIMQEYHARYIPQVVADALDAVSKREITNPAADFNMDNKVVPVGEWLTIPEGVEIVDEPDLFKYTSFPDEPAEFENREQELIVVGNKMARAASDFKRAVTKARLNEISDAKGELSKAINEWNETVGEG